MATLVKTFVTTDGAKTKEAAKKKAEKLRKQQGVPVRVVKRKTLAGGDKYAIQLQITTDRPIKRSKARITTRTPKLR